MNLKVHNTLNNRRESFEPMQPNKIGIYACGITVYDVCHIGHGMQAIVYDVMRDYLEYRGFEVTYVRNYTDVDDKIIQRATELGIAPLEHSENMIAEAEADLALLGVKNATIQPRVSQNIPEIIDLIQSLIDKGHAYEAGGDVYFNVKDWDCYGALSNRHCEEMIAGSRVNINPNKRDPMDFALWKSAKEGEISWSSPWSDGRPGWHIECSALAMKYLGDTFDIHGGGKDLIFPHHENEIAQSCAATGKPFARYWVHNGLVTVDGRKMSKSLKNFMSVRDAVARYYPETIRYTILSHHYSANIDFSEKAFYDAYSRLIYFYQTFQRIEALTAQFPDHPQSIPDGIQLPDVEAAFQQAMDDDFNASIALREIGSAFKFLNDLLTAKKPKLKQKVFALTQLAGALKRVLAVLNLVQRDPSEALAEIQTYLIRERQVDVTLVETLMNQRAEAREAKDWTRADELRLELTERGILVMDTPTGSTWQVQP